MMNTVVSLFTDRYKDYKALDNGLRFYKQLDMEEDCSKHFNMQGTKHPNIIIIVKVTRNYNTVNTKGYTKYVKIEDDVADAILETSMIKIGKMLYKCAELDTTSFPINKFHDCFSIGNKNYTIDMLDWKRGCM
jgi:hypothetical protein